MTDEIRVKTGVYRAMCAVKMKLAKYGGITKDRQAPDKAGGYQFRGIDDMFNVLCELTASEGLCMFPRVVGEPRIEFGASSKGTPQTHVFLVMDVDFVSAEDGSMHTARVIGEAIDTGDKASNEAMSAAYKYAHLHPFQIPTHGEVAPDDTEAYVNEVAARRTPPPAPKSEPKVEPEPPPAKRQTKKSSPTQALRDEIAAKEAPANDQQPQLIGDQPLFQPGPSTLLDRVLQCNDLGLLHEFARQAQADNAEQVVWNAIRNRGAFLFSQAENVSEIVNAKPFIVDMGSPKILVDAANLRYTELNQKGAR